LLPHDFPNRSTVQRSFYAWQTDGLWERINFVLLQQARERAGREASPSGGVIDSQSVKTTESGGRSTFAFVARRRKLALRPDDPITEGIRQHQLKR